MNKISTILARLLELFNEKQIDKTHTDTGVYIMDE
jgi:hypothetical protein